VTTSERSDDIQNDDHNEESAQAERADSYERGQASDAGAPQEPDRPEVEASQQEGQSMNDRRSERERILGQSKAWSLSDAHRLQVRLLLLIEDTLHDGLVAIRESLDHSADNLNTEPPRTLPVVMIGSEDLPPGEAAE